jgi:hypothetical protein
VITLRDLADGMLRLAKHEHTSQGQASQNLMIVPRGDRRYGIVPIHGPLRDYQDALIQSVRMLDGYALIFCAELWMIKHQMPKNYPDISVLDLPEPKESPERGECLRALCVTDGSIFSKFVVIKRTPFGTSFEDQDFVESEHVFRDGTTEFLQHVLAAK